MKNNESSRGQSRLLLFVVFVAASLLVTLAMQHMLGDRSEISLSLSTASSSDLPETLDSVSEGVVDPSSEERGFQRAPHEAQASSDLASSESELAKQTKREEESNNERVSGRCSDPRGDSEGTTVIAFFQLKGDVVVQDTTVTDSLGGFSFEVPGGALEVFVKAERFNEHFWGARSLVKRGLRKPLDFSLHEILDFREVEVVDQASQGIADVTAYVFGPLETPFQDANSGSAEARCRELGKTDGAGRARLPWIPRVGCYLRLEAKGYFPQLVSLPALSPRNESALPEKFVMEPALVLEGVAPSAFGGIEWKLEALVDYYGSQVPGARVAWENPKNTKTEAELTVRAGTSFRMPTAINYWPIIRATQVRGERPGLVRVALLDRQTETYKRWLESAPTEFVYEEAGLDASQDFTAVLSFQIDGMGVSNRLKFKAESDQGIFGHGYCYFEGDGRVSVSLEGVPLLKADVNLAPGRVLLPAKNLAASEVRLEVRSIETNQLVPGHSMVVVVSDEPSARPKLVTSDEHGMVRVRVGVGAQVSVRSQRLHEDSSEIMKFLVSPELAQPVVFKVTEQIGSIRVRMDELQAGQTHRVALMESKATSNTMTAMGVTDLPEAGIRAAQKTGWDLRAALVLDHQWLVWEDIPAGDYLVYAFPVPKDGTSLLLNIDRCRGAVLRSEVRVRAAETSEVDLLYPEPIHVGLRLDGPEELLLRSTGTAQLRLEPCVRSTNGVVSSQQAIVQAEARGSGVFIAELNGAGVYRVLVSGVGAANSEHVIDAQAGSQHELSLRGEVLFDLELPKGFQCEAVVVRSLAKQPGDGISFFKVPRESSSSVSSSFPGAARRVRLTGLNPDLNYRFEIEAGELKAIRNLSASGFRLLEDPSTDAPAASPGIEFLQRMRVVMK